MKEATIQMELTQALPEDFKTLKGWEKQSFGYRKKYTRKIGQIFWIRSQITGLFEGPYIIDNNTSMKDLKIYLDNQMVFIPKHVLQTKIKTLLEREVAEIPTEQILT